MDKQASQLMGENVIAGVMLEAQEAIKEMVGGVIGGVLTGSEAKPASLPGDHEGLFYVAIGPSKVGFFAVKRGLFKNSIDKMLVEHPRGEVQTVEIKSGVMPPAHFVFKDGTNYVLTCARINLGKLKKVQEVLTAQ